MKIKHKFSILVILIFILNISFLLGFYNIYLYPNISNEVFEIKENIEELTRENISSKVEAENLITQINMKIKINELRTNVTKDMFVTIIIFEAIILFVILVIASIVVYMRYTKPIDELVLSMDDYSNGVLPKEKTYRNDEIGKLQTQFIELTKVVETERQKQTQIIASIAHDVKTPLTVIMGYSERLLSKKITPQRESKYLSAIYSKAVNINEIINEFDEYLSYNFEGTLALKEYPISDICRYVREEYCDELSDIGVNFTVINQCANTNVSVDLIKFKRVIGNLIGNSVKAMKNDPTITITASSSKHTVIFTLSDNGTGVSESQLPYIFDPLYTSDSSRKVAGLGLSICKNIVAAHKGEISAKNGANGGLVMEIVLPV